MRFLAFLLVICFNVYSFCAEYKFLDFVFDFDDGWSQVKGTDPNSVFRIEKNGSYIEFIKMEDELSDFYLNSMISKQKESIFSKGLKPSEIKTASIHGVSKAYYFYYTDTKINIVSLFTYSQISFTVIASGISEEIFKNLIFKFRKEGEKIEIPIAKPKPKPKPKPITKKEKEPNVGFISISDLSTSTLTITSSSVLESSVSTTTEVTQSLIVSSVVEKEKMEDNFISTQNTKEDKNLISNIIGYLDKSKGKKAIIERKPLNKYFVLSLVIIYFVAIFIFKLKFSSYSNPKMKPYPKDMPPDFFFPIIVIRVRMLEETLYQIITRTNQFLSAHYNHSYKKFTTIGISFIMYLHIIWSLSEFIKANFFQNLILSLPLGSYIISFIELPFIVIILYGVYSKAKENRMLVIKDSQMNLITTTVKENGSFVVKNSQGRSVTKVKRRGSLFKREWVCYDEDDKEIFVIKDDYPLVWMVTKILGNKFLKARSYYSIYIEGDKRIGFLFLDPNSYDGYQIHYDFDYFRLINPMYLSSVFLYIISTQKEESFLFL